MAIGFKHGASGVSQLGAIVVSGSTKPTDPKENTIWVNDSYNYSMGSWSFSPDEPHRVSKSRNLIVFPYLSGTLTNSGVTFTVDSTSTSASEKGKITVNGTNNSSSNIVFRLSNESLATREILLQPGRYVLCGNCESSSSTTHRLLIAYSYDNWASYADTIYDNEGTGIGFAVEKVAKARISIQIRGGKTASNAVYKPMLVREGESTVYTMGNATGQIWIKTGTGGTIALDTVKGKNETIVTPITAYEYFTNSGWVKKTAEVYQYGAWKALEDPSAPVTPEAPWDGYYFNNGNQYEGVTGGWSTNGWVNSGTVSVGDTIVASTASGQYARVGTVNTVDLSSVKKLWFDSPSGNNGYDFGYLAVTSKKTGDDFAASVTITAGRGSLDVSNLSGQYYICVYVVPKAYADISAVWKE